MQKDIAPRDRIIFALDVPDAKTALALVDRLESRLGFYKVGLQLFLAEGFSIVDRLAERGHKVMLDLKLHDIPKTVELAVRQFAGHDISLATVHGYAPTVAAAAAAKGRSRILAVTVLTSMGQKDLAEAGYRGSVEDLVLKRAQTAVALGCDGLVCSGLEAPRLRAALGPGPLLVTPGVRPAGGLADDQTRVVTAGAAIAGGADHLVVGRPIQYAAAPLAVIDAMNEEIAAALEG